MTTPVPRRTSGYGWIPDLPDARDHMFSLSPVALIDLPSRVDLRDGCPKVYDQGRIGSCTANAIAAAFEFCLLKQALPDFLPSRMFIYYNERAVEGNIAVDAGAMLRDGIKSVAKAGTCTETEWPYDDTPADRLTGLFPPHAHAVTRPTDVCYRSALHNRITSYRRLPRDLNQYRACLAGGQPFVFGFSVYESFEGAEVARTGIVRMPESGERVVGGHAVMAVGYEDRERCFIVRNSWGVGWGNQGYFTMPYEYLTNRGLASDFWTLSIVT
jgi:C1A family cysteine protease